MSTSPPVLSPTMDMVTFVRWIATKNPFYAVSVALVLLGLWLSFGTQDDAVETSLLMASLAGYTLLLAGTALVLVRYLKLWEDARTVLCLVVLMFLATSVTFDQVLMVNPLRGAGCCLFGLGLAIAVSEGVLAGIHLRLPLLYRVPYYLLLALFFLYPIFVGSMMSRAEPLGERGMWALFGFPFAAAILLLTLLPALRCGAGYLGETPLPWPYYPWSLFVFLGVAVVGRSVLLCWSMQPLGLNQIDRLVFGPYFLVPLGFAVAILALEMGRVLKSAGPTRFAMLLPPALFFLAAIGHDPSDPAYRYLRVMTITSGDFRAFAPVRMDPDPVYNKFLDLFSERLGADPLFWTLLLATAFYGYAALRGVRWATGGLSLSLAAMSVVATNSLRVGWLSPPQAGPLLAPAALQFYLGWRRRSSVSLLFASVCTAAAIALAAPVSDWPIPEAKLRFAIFGNLVALAMLILGAIFHDPVGRAIRSFGVLGAFFFAAIVVHPLKVPELPWTIHVVYPLLVGILLTAYGYWQRHSLTMIAATILLGYWLFTWGWTAYQYVRTSLKGFDYLASGMACFAIAVLVSLAKAGVLRRWLGERWPWSRRLRPATVEAAIPPADEEGTVIE
jgi:hypothetical protein